MFAIGKTIADAAMFPPEINDIPSSLSSLNVAYQINHRNGDIGYYKLVEFKPDLKKAVMECNNPYSSDFDQGIIINTLRKFRPRGSFIQVELDTTKKNRLNGGDACLFNITW